MKRFLTVLGVMVAILALAGGEARAGQKQAAQSPQVPPLTTEQMVMDCTISGVLFSAAGAIGRAAAPTATAAEVRKSRRDASRCAMDSFSSPDQWKLWAGE